MSNQAAYPILLVDDDLQHLAGVQALVSSFFPHITVLKASCGADALRCIERQNVSLLLIKPSLPDMKGLEVAMSLCRKIPVLFLSKDIPVRELEALEGTELLVDYLTLPVHPVILRHRIGAYLQIGGQREMQAKCFRLSQELLEAGRQKSNFILNMSHELRTPLNAMIGYTSLTLNALRGKIAPEFVENLSKAERASRHLLQLINDILDFSKIEAGRAEMFFEEIDTADMLDDVLITTEELLNNKALTLQHEIASDLPPIESDYAKLKQILDNLLNNAVKFTTRGMVTVRAKPVHDDAAIRIEVEDTGEGIAEETLSSIFESFRQGDGSIKKKFGGTGLGLAITKSFCDMLHIELGVKSTLGEGTLFWLNIPAQQKDISAPRSNKLLNPSTEERKSPESILRSILIVDDDPMNLDLHHTIFQTAGYVVFTADSGKGGIALAQKHHPDVILMDLAMPGLDGYEVTQQLKQMPQTADIFVIACSAFATRESQRRAYEVGCQGYLTKPVDPELLVSQVKKIFRGAQESK